MWHIPKNVKPKRGLNVAYQFLGGSDILQENDLVRSTGYPNTYSDEINYNYINSMNWEKVKTGLSGWVGRSVDEMKATCGHDKEIIRMVILPKDLK